MTNPLRLYLDWRGITLPIPPTIRLHRDLRHPEAKKRFPAMVAAVQGPDRKFIGCHRTYLTLAGRKADVEPLKMSLGPISGGAVRLAAAAEEIAIGEGIETCLSFMQLFGIPAWAGLSTSGVRSIVLPPLPLARVVHIAIDVDPNKAGERAAEAAGARFCCEGRKVRFAFPSVGCKDFNDMVVRHVAT